MIGRNLAVTLTAVAVVGIVTTLFFLGGAATGSIFGKVTLPALGTIRAVGVGVYWNSGCSNIVTSVDWGVVEPGATKHVQVYIKNEGSEPVTLALATESWSPAAAASYLTLTWDYDGSVILAEGVEEVTLTLTVSDTIEGITSFSFDIIITGSG